MESGRHAQKTFTGIMVCEGVCCVKEGFKAEVTSERGFEGWSLLSRQGGMREHSMLGGAEVVSGCWEVRSS